MLQSEWGWVKPSLNVWGESFFCVFLFQLNSIFLGLFLSVLKLLSAVFWVPLLLVNCWNTGGEARMYYPSTWPAGCLWSCLHSTVSIWERLVLRWSWTMYCYLYLPAKIFPQQHCCAEYTVGYSFAFVKKLLQLLYWYIYYISSISSFLKSAPRLQRLSLATWSCPFNQG